MLLCDLLPLSATLAILVHLLLHCVLLDLHLGHILLLDHIDHLHFLNLLVFLSELLHRFVVLFAIEFIRIDGVCRRIQALLARLLRGLRVCSYEQMRAERRRLGGRGRT